MICIYSEMSKHYILTLLHYLQCSDKHANTLRVIPQNLPITLAIDLDLVYRYSNFFSAYSEIADLLLESHSQRYLDDILAAKIFICTSLRL